jgi:hypothetical protein
MHLWRPQLAHRVLLAAYAAATLVGCGSTRTSNTMRTATEQMLISDAIDRTVDDIDFAPLAQQAVFFDDSKLVDVVDRGYLISGLRQHMLASGCILKEKREDAEFIVEPRAGAVGTDNHDLLFGVPAIQVPQVGVATTIPAAIPEIPFAKRRDQSGVAKVAVFAYRRDTGEPVWQSGIIMNKSTANDIWVLGAGPFQRGTIYDKALFAGKQLDGDEEEQAEALRDVHVASVDDSAVFAGLHGPESTRVTRDPGVQQASAIVPATSTATQSTETLPPAPLADEAPVLAPPPRPISEAPAPAG